MRPVIYDKDERSRSSIKVVDYQTQVVSVLCNLFFKRNILPNRQRTKQPKKQNHIRSTVVSSLGGPGRYVSCCSEPPRHGNDLALGRWTKQLSLSFSPAGFFAFTVPKITPRKGAQNILEIVRTRPERAPAPSSPKKGKCKFLPGARSTGFFAGMRDINRSPVVVRS